MRRTTQVLGRGGHLAGRLSGLDVLVGLGSQQAARRNAATASALLLRRREEREQVEAFLDLYAAGKASVAADGTA
jgi:hypothetical protein